MKRDGMEATSNLNEIASPQATTPTQAGSHSRVLKSSALIGASTVISVALRIVRTKAMALFVGPAGVGLLGLYDSIVLLVQSLAGLGINSSGVRQIAEAVGSGDARRIACTVWTLRRVTLFTGLLGALLLLALSKPISRLSFGDDRHVYAIALLSLVVLFREISAGQGALVQGMRRIADLARMNVLGAFYGTIFSIPIVYFFRERGIVPFLVCVAVMGIVTSWWYARKVQVERVIVGFRDAIIESSALIKFGVALMSSSLLGMGSAYLVRIIILHQLGLQAAGYYQAAWALGGLYVWFILSAMYADFYPRLTGVANHNMQCNRLVNEQAEVGLLMAGPGILATLTLAPLATELFYSAKFWPAVEVLRWFCLGMILRVVAWPLGLILQARAEAKIFFWSELATYFIQVCAVWFLVRAVGLKGAGIGFFGMNVFYLIMIYSIVRRLSGFHWSAMNQRLAIFFVPQIAVLFIAGYFLPMWATITVGLAITILACIYSIRTFTTLIPIERLPQTVRRLFTLCHLVPPADRDLNSHR